MARRELTGMRYEEIKRMLQMGISARAISRALKCSRLTVKRIERGEMTGSGQTKAFSCPIWAERIDWSLVLKDFQGGHPLKFIWEEKAKDTVTYVNFWKQFNRRFPECRKGLVTHREFAPAQRCEVDYAGEKALWINLNTGQEHEVVVFVGALCFSQYIFANASADAKSPNFLGSHREMYEHFGGVPHMTVPDCLRQGVSKCHIYDPDINPLYVDLAKFYGTAVVPARPNHPKDKAIVEGAVKVVMRYFKWLYRDHVFTSLSEINRALREVTDRINSKPHTRFKISRRKMWEETEKEKLKPLPKEPYEYVEWKEAKVHPDCHVSVDSNLYSVPHIYRGRKVKVKMSKSQVEIYFNAERLALHTRCRDRKGTYVTVLEHLPANSRAYREATPRNVLSQARFINPGLFDLIDDIFKKDTIGNLRRALGLIRSAREQIKMLGYEPAQRSITQACQTMRMYCRVRVPYFKELLKKFRLEKYPAFEGEIRRNPDNPMLRHNNIINGGN